MIGTIDIKVNAAHPEMPLAPFYAFINSPSQVRIINVPKAIGSWKISAVYVTANYPDNTSQSVACTLTGGCWHGTLAAPTSTGTSTNGFTITASGVKEDGTTAVTGYVLGKGDCYILDTDGTITVGSTTYYVHLVDSQPATPKKGDLCLIDNVYKIYNGTAWVALGSTGTVDWDDIENKPSAFTPTAHASTHGSSGSDPITPAAIGAEVSGAAASAVSTHNSASDAHSTQFAAKAAQTPTFTEAETRANLAGSGETCETMWGKVKKVITDFIAHLTDSAAHSSLFALKANISDFTIGSFASYVSTLFSSTNTSLTSTIKDCGGVQHDTNGYFIETED